MPKILMAEEDNLLREALVRQLCADGFEVFTASSGGESLRLASEQPPDLLILNLQLPGLDNALLRQLLQRCAAAPVLLRLTGGLEATLAASLEPQIQPGALDPAEVLARVRALLGQRLAEESRPVATLAAGDLTLDLIQRRAAQAGTVLKLTQKEFDLLAELVRHQGRVLSRDQLLTRVWGRHYAESSHTVDVHIRWLREKIETNPSAPNRILTVRGAGYRFVPYADKAALPGLAR
jgi:DNA-binding response OmpR family regulator